VMLESVEAFQHLDGILGMPGIDAVTLGPSDLAQELGLIGSPDRAKVINDYRERMIAAARKHGKDVAMMVSSLDEANRWVRAGVKMIVYASDANILLSGFGTVAKQLRQIEQS
jgi:2-keto-3-deoxy-L-rhamnonate aldolase RhmA